MDNLDIALRMVLACEAEATLYSIKQELALPTLKIVLGAICGDLSDDQITDQLEKMVDGNNISSNELADFAEFYRSVVDKAIVYLDMADEKSLLH